MHGFDDQAADATPTPTPPGHERVSRAAADNPPTSPARHDWTPAPFNERGTYTRHTTRQEARTTAPRVDTNPTKWGPPPTTRQRHDRLTTHPATRLHQSRHRAPTQRNGMATSTHPDHATLEAHRRDPPHGSTAPATNPPPNGDRAARTTPTPTPRGHTRASSTAADRTTTAPARQDRPQAPPDERGSRTGGHDAIGRTTDSDASRHGSHTGWGPPPAHRRRYHDPTMHTATRLHQSWHSDATYTMRWYGDGPAPHASDTGSAATRTATRFGSGGDKPTTDRRGPPPRSRRDTATTTDDDHEALQHADAIHERANFSTRRCRHAANSLRQHRRRRRARPQPSRPHRQTVADAATHTRARRHCRPTATTFATSWTNATTQREWARLARACEAAKTAQRTRAWPSKSLRPGRRSLARRRPPHRPKDASSARGRGKKTWTRARTTRRARDSMPNAPMVHTQPIIRI